MIMGHGHSLDSCWGWVIHLEWDVQRNGDMNFYKALQLVMTISAPQKSNCHVLSMK